MGFRLQLQIGWDKHNHICGQTNTIPHLLPGTLVGVQNKFLLVLRLAQWYLLAPPQMGLTWWFSVICEEGKCQSLHKYIFYLDKRKTAYGAQTCTMVSACTTSNGFDSVVQSDL